jgi:anti-sigma factor RsiW
MRHRGGKSTGALLCDTVQLAISAGLDGEPVDLAGARVAAHMADCESCRQFDEGARLLRGQLSLRTSRRAPGALKELLAGELVDSVGPAPPLAAGLGRALPRPGWGRMVRWAGALIPAAAVVVALPLGALSAAQAKPTHAPTPCTQNLRSYPMSSP